MKLSREEIKQIFDKAKEHNCLFQTEFNKNLIKSDFTLNLNALTPWTKADGQQFLTQVILGAPTRKLISRQSGVKYISELKYLDTTSGLQQYAKGWSPQGTTTLTVKNVSTTKMMSQELLYPEDLNDYSTQLSLHKGFNKELPAALEIMYAELKGLYISRDIEFYDWSTTNGSPNGRQWAGLGYKIPRSVGGATGATYTAFDWAGFVTGGTYTSLMNTFDTMLGKLPEAILDTEKITWFVPPVVFRKMLAVLRDGPTGSGNFHIDVVENDGSETFRMPAFRNVEVISTPGLSSENPAQWNATVMTPAFNLVGLDDKDGEDQEFKLIVNPYELYYQFYMFFKAGIDFYFANYITYSQASNYITYTPHTYTGATGSTFQIAVLDQNGVNVTTSCVFSGTTNKVTVNSATGLATLGYSTSGTGTVYIYYNDPATGTQLTGTITTQGT